MKLISIKKNTIFLFLFILTLSSYSQKREDLNLWTNISVNKSLKDFDFTLTEEFRFFQNISEIEEFYTDFGISYKINKHFYLGLNYRLKFNHTYINQYQNSHRINFDIKYKFGSKRINCYYRLRIQNELGNILNSTNNDDFGYKMRNKINISYDIKDFVITPFLSVEPYTDLVPYYFLNVSKLRLTVGFEIDKKKLSGFSIFYRLEKTFTEKYPVNDYIIGISYAFDL